MRNFIIIVVAIVFAIFHKQVLASLWSFSQELPGVQAYLHYSTPNMRLFILCNYVAVGAAIVSLGALVWVPGRIVRIAVSLGASVVVAGTWYLLRDITTALPDYIVVHLTASFATILLVVIHLMAPQRLWPEKARAPDPRLYVLD